MKRRILPSIMWLFLGLTLFSLPVTQAFCEEWVLLSTFTNGDLFYYDRHSIKNNSKNTTQVRTLIKYSEIGKAEDKQKMKEAGISEAEMIKRGHHKLHYTTVLWEIRCKHNLSCMLTIIDYDEKGNILTSIHVPATESCSNLRPETSELYPLYYMMCDKQAGVK